MAGTQELPRKEEDDSDDLFETVDWSCCCCSRRTGMLILGVSFFCLSLVALALCSAGISHMTNNPQVISIKMKLNVSNSSGPKMQLHPNIEELTGTLRSQILIREGMLMMLNIQAGLSGMGLVSAAFLLWGAWYNRAPAVLPWLINTCAEILFLIGAAIYCFSVAMSVRLPLLDMDGFFALVFMFLFCLPCGYCVLAVATYYRELKGVKYSRFAAPRPTSSGQDAELPRTTSRPSDVSSTTTSTLMSTGGDNPAYESTKL